MALRILLADESATIKKVIELSLQDYAVDLRIVNLGVDVLDVAKNFNPDIIFVDILLQKKNGYEVCNDIKADDTTKQIPVIMLWSGFMELDQAKLKAVGANDTLEKPFDSDAIRSLVDKHVTQSSQDNPLMEHVNVPDIPAPNDFTQVKTLDEIESGIEEISFDTPSSPNIETDLQEQDSPQVAVQEQSATEKSEDWNMESFDGLPDLDFPAELNDLDEEEDENELEEDDFSHFEIKTTAPGSEEKPDTVIEIPEDDGEGGDWVNQSLGKFQLDLPEEEDVVEDLDNLEVGSVTEPIENTNFLWTPDSEESSTEADAEVNLEQEDKKPKEIITKNAGSIPSEVEIASAPEISLSAETENDTLEIEHNHELGIETYSDDYEDLAPEVNQSPLTAPAVEGSSDAIANFLNSPEFESMVKTLIEKKVVETVERLIPELAKSSIESEIQRLLDEPFQEQ